MPCKNTLLPYKDSHPTLNPNKFSGRCLLSGCSAIPFVLCGSFAISVWGSPFIFKFLVKTWSWRINTSFDWVHRKNGLSSIPSKPPLFLRVLLSQADLLPELTFSRQIYCFFGALLVKEFFKAQRYMSKCPSLCLWVGYICLILYISIIFYLFGGSLSHCSCRGSVDEWTPATLHKLTLSFACSFSNVMCLYAMNYHYMLWLPSSASSFSPPFSCLQSTFPIASG